MGEGWREVDGPPPIPSHRLSMRPSELRSLTGSFVAEVGVGTVHVPKPQPLLEPHTRTVDLNKTVKDQFDPSGRLNPGRRVW